MHLLKQHILRSGAWRRTLTLPPLHVSLAECFNSSKENDYGKEYESALHAGIQV